MWGIALSQSADEILPKVKTKKYFYEFGLNAVTIQKRLFRGYTTSLQDQLIPYYTPGIYFKVGSRKRVLRISANYYHAVGEMSMDNFAQPASIFDNPKILLSYQEAELKIGYQRYWRPLKRVQPYYVCDFSFSAFTEKSAQTAYYYNNFSGDVAYGSAISQLWGLRINLFSNLYLSGDSGFSLVYQQSRYTFGVTSTDVFPRWIALNLGLGLKL